MHIAFHPTACDEFLTLFICTATEISLLLAML